MHYGVHLDLYPSFQAFGDELVYVLPYTAMSITDTVVGTGDIQFDVNGNRSGCSSLMTIRKGNPYILAGD